jgi:hypothetical protein
VLYTAASLIALWEVYFTDRDTHSLTLLTAFIFPSFLAQLSLNNDSITLTKVVRNELRSSIPSRAPKEIGDIILTRSPYGNRELGQVLT